MKINKPKIMNTKRIANIEFADVDHADAPDYCDAYILAAEYIEDDGSWRDCTEQELDELNDDRDFVYDRLMEYLT